MLMSFITMFVLLLFSHALADYPLQGDFLARAKRRDGMPGVPWQWALGWHAFIHAVGVSLVMNSLLPGIVELIAHAAIDYVKSREKIGFSTDQALHVSTKILIVALRFWRVM